MFKSVFITGASSGIGEALSQYYAAPGVTLGLLSLSHVKQLEEVAKRCRNQGATVFTYQADASVADALERSAEDYLERAQFVDLVIANAGISKTEDADYNDRKVPMQNMAVNYFGVINTILAFLPAMKEKRSGQLAVISSISSLRGTHNSGAYSASKAAVNLWTESLRLRLLPFNITVTTLCVGFVDTAMTKNIAFWMPGIISAEKAARLIARSIYRRKRLLIIPWHACLIWTLLHIIPGRVYDLLIAWAKARQTKKDSLNY